MLNPTKHSHPDRTVISVAYLILKQLKSGRSEKFDDLRKHVRKALQHVRNTDVLFLPAINLLFLLGLVEYRTNTDTFEFTNRSE